MADVADALKREMTTRNVVEITGQDIKRLEKLAEYSEDPAAYLRLATFYLRRAASYEFVRHLHVLAGFDDPFNSDLTTWFLGGSLRFDDEDLKSLLTVAPSISTK